MSAIASFLPFAFSDRQRQQCVDLPTYKVEDCTDWEFGRMQMLMDKIQNEWDKYGNLPSRLPDDLRQRYAKLCAKG